jgi:hypothetical protein
MPRHKLTPDDRRRGQARGAETKRAQRDEAEQEARNTLADAASEAVATLVAELNAEDATVRLRAAAQILDRAWGRPRQQVEASVALTPTVAPAEVDAAAVLSGLEELGLISRPSRLNNGDGDA